MTTPHRPVSQTSRLLLLSLMLITASGCGLFGRSADRLTGPPPFSIFSDPLALTADPRTAAEKIVNGAKLEVRRGVVYDASYVTLKYPGGDVPADRGACTDVVVRALRHAGYDLQVLIHEDMRRNFRRYPQKYGLRRPDRSIDHRRTPNHVAFLKRFGKALPTAIEGEALKSWKPGDLLYCRLSNGLGHCGVISDSSGPGGRPLVLHNAGTAALEDLLPHVEVTDHFRFP